MPVAAALRVTSEPGTRPSAKAIEDAASALERLGFSVVSQGRFAITVEAPEERFRDVFGVDLRGCRTLVVDVKPSDPALASAVDLLEVVEPPRSF